ncbi:MAG: MBOAT family protein, partial [Burkholderiales bacterium]|nr:MBOAT family protein [Burkholderiales bacterium]
MLFNSTAFLFAFLPLVLAGFFVIGSRSREAAAWWLAIASLVFYAGWSWRYVPLLLGSIGFNFLVAVAIARLSGKASSRRATAILIIG